MCNWVLLVTPAVSGLRGSRTSPSKPRVLPTERLPRVAETQDCIHQPLIVQQTGWANVRLYLLVLTYSF